MTDAVVVAGSGRSILGEGVTWSARQNAVFWVDILGLSIRRLSLADGAVTRWDSPERTGWLIERRHDDGFIAGLQSGFHDLTLPDGSGMAQVVRIADPEPDLPDNRMNDAAADPQGHIWAGTMPVSCEGASGAFYRLDADRTWAKVDAAYTIANGPAISPDGRWLFHTDTALDTIFRFAINDDGSLGPRSVHIAIDSATGHPDGMTLDAEGCLWVARWGGGRVTRFDADGKEMRHIPLPASQITRMAFAGPDLDRMFVTSAADGVDHEEHAGALFEVDPGCRGLPTLAFAG
ncbi:SMP-30/gluconolactonase/LRE family protein [uncultured Sphingomonas sp.]|uniref:SMP-30/gluconolactonase/LRE family protein n=1 Tax=uncultured Sphingomonas sp. TaxID=158754 RepID=UPI0025D33205|nr:SMP-30/gluconolactonase/LRE family protein [uncultured Sphingomonas sp.]